MSVQFRQDPYQLGEYTRGRKLEYDAALLQGSLFPEQHEPFYIIPKEVTFTGNKVALATRKIFTEITIKNRTDVPVRAEFIRAFSSIFASSTVSDIPADDEVRIPLRESYVWWDSVLMLSCNENSLPSRGRFEVHYLLKMGSCDRDPPLRESWCSIL